MKIYYKRSPPFVFALHNALDGEEGITGETSINIEFYHVNFYKNQNPNNKWFFCTCQDQTEGINIIKLYFV